MGSEIKFNAAVKVIQNVSKDGSYQTSNELKVQFYAYYKQATVGPCNIVRPGWWDPVARTKYDAWASLGFMSKNKAMDMYVELLKQIIETMSYTPEVEAFIETLGSFYEYAEYEDSEDKELDDETGDDDDDEGNQTIEEMIGRYVPPESGIFNDDPDEEFLKRYGVNVDEMPKKKVLKKKCKNDAKDSDSDCDIVTGETMVQINRDENLNIFLEGEKLVKEMQETKKALDATQSMLLDVRSENSVKVGVSDCLNQQDLDKMLGRYEGFVPPKKIDIEDLEMSFDDFHSDSHCDRKDINLNTIVDKNTVNNNQDIEVSGDSLSSDEDIYEDPMTDDVVESLDSGIYESDSLLGSAVGSREKTKSILNAPIHVRRTPSTHSINLSRQVCEDDEILIVSSDCNEVSEEIIMRAGIDGLGGSSHQSRHSVDFSYQIHWAVERLSKDMEHVIARMRTLESLVAVQRRIESQQLPAWWPFNDLRPKSVLFIVTWPLIAHGVLALIKAAVQRSRR